MQSPIRQSSFKSQLPQALAVCLFTCYQTSLYSNFLILEILPVS